MCQYSSRCPTKRHRPGTVCPYAGSGGSSWGASAPRPRVVRPATAPRYKGAGYAAGASGADLLVVIVLALVWDRYYEETGWLGVIGAVLLVLVPFAIAASITWTCTAWNGTVEGRCKKRRPPFVRCEVTEHRRPAQLVTFPEVVAVLSIAIGIANAVILLGAAA